MSKLKEFMDEWFPKTGWEHVKTFILDSGVELVEQENQKWLPGYTNISKSSKPHHEDKYIRYMEESMFMLHDTLHQLFTINVFCDEEEYSRRQLYGELFVFYLTEYLLPNEWYDKHAEYIDDVRDCYWLMQDVMQERPDNINRIEWMWKVFIEDINVHTFNPKPLEKYRKMFKEDLENSRKNYKFVKDLQLQDYCIVGKTSDNHINFFKAVKNGGVKNIKREFNLTLPEEWI